MNEPEKPFEKTRRRLIGKFNYTSVIAAVLGIALGSVFTFYWNDLSQFYTNKIGFGFLALLILLAFYILANIIRSYLSREYDSAIVRISEELKIVMKKRDEWPQMLRNVALELKPFLQLYSLRPTTR